MVAIDINGMCRTRPTISCCVQHKTRFEQNRHFNQLINHLHELITHVRTLSFRCTTVGREPTLRRCVAGSGSDTEVFFYRQVEVAAFVGIAATGGGQK